MSSILRKVEGVDGFTEYFSLAGYRPAAITCIDKIEHRKLIDIDKVNYEFPCGSVQCDGIRQYCSAEQTCLYCNEAVCRAKNRPGQCTLQCEKGEIGKEVVLILRFYFYTIGTILC